MKRLEERKERIKKHRIITLCFFIYLSFIIACIFSINYTFNTMMSGKKYQNVFILQYKKSTIDITILGGKKTISLKPIDEKIKSLLN